MGNDTRKARDLAELVRSAGFTPGARDLAGLVDLLAEDDDELVRDVERAIVRAGATAAPALVARAKAASPRVRARVVRALGRFESEDALAYLLEALRDEDAKVRRNAAGALGKAALRRSEVEAALIEAWGKDDRVEAHRTIAQSLGNVGGAAALALLRDVKTDDAELRKIAERALLKLQRDTLRGEASAIDVSAAPREACAIALRCRAGIERLLERELGPAWSPRVVGPGLVEATLTRELASIFGARTWLRASFPLQARRGKDAAQAVIDALTSDEAHRIFTTWTRGAIRYRLAWEGRGHSRALVWSVAKGVSERRPELVNDPTSSTWEASIREDRGEVRVELAPRVEDPRFAYRTGDVPAASHPTLAAALARVAGARADDVVWDPFVGSGSELVERAKLGAYARLVGSDLDARALDVARANLAAAGVEAELSIGDATQFAPRGVTLIMTNPPMGRRVARGQLEPLVDRFVAHAAKVLAVGGRLVWLSPLGERTRAQLAAAGLKIGYRQVVDMGGFDAELQSAAKV